MTRESNILNDKIKQLQSLIKNIILGVLPWWFSGEESICQCRRHRFDPWSGKIPCAAGQLSLCATTVMPVVSSLGASITEASAP